MASFTAPAACPHATSRRRAQRSRLACAVARLATAPQRGASSDPDTASLRKQFASLLNKFDFNFRVGDKARRSRRHSPLASAPGHR